MTLKTIEGIVRDGTIRLRDDVQLPENTQVLVIVPEQDKAKIRSPRLVDPKQAPDFKKQVFEIDTNDKV